MDNSQHSDTSRTCNALVLYDKQAAENDNMARRLKNRERQRRYRARKRNEADLKKALTVDQLTPLHNKHTVNEFQPIPVHVEISVNVASPEYLTRVHCGRDWKKDARRASVHKRQEIDSNSSINCSTAPGGIPASLSQFDPEADKPSSHSNISIQESNLTHRFISKKRHWKVEARNKKNFNQSEN